MFLFIHVKTSDLIRRDLPLDDQNQPWIVFMAAELTDQDGVRIAGFDTGIRADGRKIRSGAERVHGISTRTASRQGVNEIVALGMLVGLAAQAEYVIGYQMEFDRDCVASVLMRRGKSTEIWMRPGLQFIDCQKPAAAICKIPSEHDSGEYKYPSLTEACESILASEPFESYDLARLKTLFFKLRDLNAVDIE